MIDVATTEPYGDYPALTVRAAIAPFILPLTPGQSVTIGSVRKLDGTVLPVQTLQVHVKQVAPPGWSVVTRSLPDGDLLVRRIA